MDTKDILKKLRASRGLTLQEVAEKSGVSYSAYQKYELGLRELGAKSLEKLADFYGVTTDYLLGRQIEPKPLEQLVKINNLNVTEEVLLEEYMKLDPQKRKVIIDFMKSGIKEAEKREASEKPPIQVKQGQSQEQAIARTSDPTKQYRPAPTAEQLKSFTVLTPEDFGEREK